MLCCFLFFFVFLNILYSPDSGRSHIQLLQCLCCMAAATWENKAAPVTTAMHKSLYYLQPVPSAFTRCLSICLQSSYSIYFQACSVLTATVGKGIICKLSAAAGWWEHDQCVGWGSKLLPCHLQMAKAGFVHCPNANRPDVAKCFFCLIELESWEPNDDPW